jgi:hypothetical protein
LVAEALSLRNATVFAMERGFNKVVLEVDCSELVRHWLERESDRSIIKPMVDEISELSVSFISFSVVFACREANHAAHSCAKYGLLQEGSFLWDTEPTALLLQS